jgi:hypothetical protein
MGGWKRVLVGNECHPTRRNPIHEFRFKNVQYSAPPPLPSSIALSGSHHTPAHGERKTP